MSEAASFTCPSCGAVSYNPNDLKHGYCGRCEQFTAKREPTQFLCVDCTSTVIDFTGGPVPDPPRCHVCTWVAQVSDESERAALRARLSLSKC